MAASEFRFGNRDRPWFRSRSITTAFIYHGLKHHRAALQAKPWSGPLAGVAARTTPASVADASG